LNTPTPHFSINQESECPEVSVEGNQTASQPSELVDTHDQPQSQLQAGAISKSDKKTFLLFQNTKRELLRHSVGHIFLISNESSSNTEIIKTKISSANKYELGRTCC
jgi:hypothetical protein